MRLTNTCRCSEDRSTGETTVYLPDELKVALERLARLLGRSESALTREMIEDRADAAAFLVWGAGSGLERRPGASRLQRAVIILDISGLLSAIGSSQRLHTTARGSLEGGLWKGRRDRSYLRRSYRPS